MEALWPDMPYEATLRSLRVTLHAARHALEPELAPRSPSAYLHTEGELIRLDRDLILIDADEATTVAAHALPSAR